MQEDQYFESSNEANIFGENVQIFGFKINFITYSMFTYGFVAYLIFLFALIFLKIKKNIKLSME